MLIRLLDTDGLREAFDNSPALQRWVKAPKTGKVPAGTIERFFRPCGTLFSWVRARPSAEALGYFHDIPPFHTRVVKQSDKQGMKHIVLEKHCAVRSEDCAVRAEYCAG